MTQSVTPFAQGAVQRAVQRAGWLAELAAALDQASRLTVALFDHKGDSRDATILREQIRVLRSEVDSMQRRRQPAGRTNSSRLDEFLSPRLHARGQVAAAAEFGQIRRDRAAPAQPAVAQKPRLRKAVLP